MPDMGHKPNGLLHRAAGRHEIRGSLGTYRPMFPQVSNLFQKPHRISEAEREGDMKSSDPYAATDELDDLLLQVIVTRLEARGKHPLFEKMLQDYLDAMQI